MRIDPEDATKQIPDDRLSVIDLSGPAPHLISTLKAGAGATGVAITPDGRLAMVANRAAGSVSVFRIEATSVTNLDDITLGAATSQVTAIAISPDGRTALVTRGHDNAVATLSIEGTAVKYLPPDIPVGPTPYGLAITPDGRAALIANVGSGHGTDDTVSVIDLSEKPAKTVQTEIVGPTPEDVVISPDGRWCAVVLINGTNLSRFSEAFHDAGAVAIFRIEGFHLVKVSQTAVPAWPQGAIFSPDSRRLLVESMVEHSVRIYAVSRKGSIRYTGIRIDLEGGGAAMGATAH
jgi:DNA-binding beta-propeller fold protein YncE